MPFVAKTSIVGFWERVAIAFGTERAGVIARKLGLTYNAVRKWKGGEVPALNTLLEIKRLTGSSLDWLLFGEGQPGEAPKTLGKLPPEYDAITIDAIISRMIDARICPLEKTIADLKSKPHP